MLKIAPIAQLTRTPKGVRWPFGLDGNFLLNTGSFVLPNGATRDFYNFTLGSGTTLNLAATGVADLTVIGIANNAIINGTISGNARDTISGSYNITKTIPDGLPSSNLSKTQQAGGGGYINTAFAAQSAGNGGGQIGGGRGSHGLSIYLFIKGTLSGVGSIDLRGSNGAKGAQYATNLGNGGGGAGGNGGNFTLVYNKFRTDSISYLGGGGAGGAGAAAYTYTSGKDTLTLPAGGAGSSGSTGIYTKLFIDRG